MKWILIIFVAGIIYMIATGNMGGGKAAGTNYQSVRTGGQ